jgi:hypothetical protein
LEVDRDVLDLLVRDDDPLPEVVLRRDAAFVVVRLVDLPPADRFEAGVLAFAFAARTRARTSSSFRIDLQPVTPNLVASLPRSFTVCDRRTAAVYNGDALPL